MPELNCGRVLEAWAYNFWNAPRDEQYAALISGMVACLETMQHNAKIGMPHIETQVQIGHLIACAKHHKKLIAKEPKEPIHHLKGEQEENNDRD
jgi:hypothetical protein